MHWCIQWCPFNCTCLNKIPYYSYILALRRVKNWKLEYVRLRKIITKNSISGCHFWTSTVIQYWDLIKIYLPRIFPFVLLEVYHTEECVDVYFGLKSFTKLCTHVFAASSLKSSPVFLSPVASPSHSPPRGLSFWLL